MNGWEDLSVCRFFATGFTTSLQKNSWDLTKKGAMSTLGGMAQVATGRLFVGHLSLSEQSVLIEDSAL